MGLDAEADPLILMRLFLDVLSDQPGAILYRGPNYWQALLPRNPGDVLTLDTELLPVWLPPT